ncbi:hypothetical protein [Halomonas sp. GFAJ-1]|uniref:hypothetical protein n=1 Tax=Halomonas sp. GFAJ-1 TaxID=1118153 RepID=UPI00023A4693|nr:hypothetical protein [Halomonas sp. GFAJ-1]AVI62922.1 hypothetical protein BB497_09540 [Halomonas sp. GFAJ-1]EHK62043.1 hypothetical protein MOY_03458 [Halomonas sp. GFAJ-1]
MNINFQPLTGHPYTIKARIDVRSAQELLGFTDNSSYKSGASDRAQNVVLTHPPVLLLPEGGGEQLLNRPSITAQLNSMKSSLKNSFSLMENLVVYIVEEASIKSDHSMLLSFLLGTIQQLHYKKKDSAGSLLWKKAANEISQNPALKTCIENTLFNSAKLSLRHYKTLLNAANLSESSLAHMPDIKTRKKPENKKNTEPKGKLERTPTDNSTEIKKTSTNFDHQKKPSNFEKSLAIINNAAEKAEKQFSLNVEL